MPSTDDYGDDDVFASLDTSIDPDLLSSPIPLPFTHHPAHSDIFASPERDHNPFVSPYQDSVPISSLFSTHLFASLTNPPSQFSQEDRIVPDNYNTNRSALTSDSFTLQPESSSNSGQTVRSAGFNSQEMNRLQMLSQGSSHLPFALEPAPILTPPKSLKRSQDQRRQDTSSDDDNDDVVITPTANPALENVEPPVKRLRPNSLLEHDLSVTIPNPAENDVGASPSVDIVFSPQKGRRLQLPHTPTPTGPRLPPVQPPTPTRSGGLRPAHELEAYHRLGDESPTTVRQTLLHKRLRAFTSAPPPRPVVKPVEMEGRGRVLMRWVAGKPLEGTPSPLKLKPRRGRGRHVISTAHAEAIEELSGMSPEEAEEVHRKLREAISWVDDQHPWNANKMQRAFPASMTKDLPERVGKLLYFLHDESDFEEEDQFGFDPFNWGAARSWSTQRVADLRSGCKVVESADAKEAFMAHRLVKQIMSERGATLRQDGEQLEGGEEEEDENALHCICRQPDDGRGMVRCDQCDKWFHQDCVGIENSDLLGDQWYCDACNLEEEELSRRQPILVPTVEEPYYREASGHVPLYQLQNSPNAPGPSGLLLPPRTPRRRHDPAEVQTPARRPRQGMHGHATPSRRRGAKPGAKLVFEDYAIAAPDSPFDPTSTPSRGIKLGMLAGMNTPRELGWNVRGGTFAVTPLQYTAREEHAIGHGGGEPTAATVAGVDRIASAVSPLASAALISAGARHRLPNIVHQFGGVLEVRANDATAMAPYDPLKMNREDGAIAVASIWWSSRSQGK